MAGDALSVVGVDVAFGPTRVLNRVSLDVAAGELVALLGSSGCGKTTLLRAISGFAPIRAGRVLIGGKDLTDAPPERRGIAMVFQSYALWPHMTTAQNIAYGLRLRGVRRAERARRVEEVLALLGLAGLGERPVTQLSGGAGSTVTRSRSATGSSWSTIRGGSPPAPRPASACPPPPCTCIPLQGSRRNNLSRHAEAGVCRRRGFAPRARARAAISGYLYSMDR
jgi:ABC-type uncharacterized transport system YnjBCD ATPase subunit